jgi:hypothetical protein
VQANGIRKRALLRGAGWTLAVPMALAWFKSDLPEPIYLWTLGIVAAGWAAVLLHALACAQRAVSAELAQAGSEMSALIGGVVRATGDEIRGACSELSRVDELLAHAIEQLMTAFDSVSGEVQAHQRELEQQADVAMGTPAAERLRSAAGRVANDVNGVVTALQFRDVVGQKLGHVRCELEALGQVMQKIRELVAAQSGPAAKPLHRDSSNAAGLGAGVRALLQELEQPRAASPVRQALMHAGEVELF